MLFVERVKNYFLNPKVNDLLVFEATNKNVDSYEWIEKNKFLLEDHILKHGGVLLRNFNIYSVSEFNRFFQIVCPTLLDYVYRSTPKTKLEGKIYTATEYPSNRSIPLHNENTYSFSWTQKIIFYNSIVASKNGETLIADSRKIYQKLDPWITLMAHGRKSYQGERKIVVAMS